MPDKGRKEYDITLSSSFISRLQKPTSSSSRTPASASNPQPTGFAIRYSVPPDSLKSNDENLKLRKNTRGEYIVEGISSDSNDPAATGSSTATTNAQPASFKGTATQTKDTDCVLIYNPKTKKYELNVIGMDLQVSPMLKNTRLRGTSSAETLTTDAKKVLRSPVKPTFKLSSPVKSSEVRIDTIIPEASKPVIKVSTAKDHENHSANSTSRSSKAAPAITTPAGRTSLTSTSAALVPKRSTKAKLPTRKKMPVKPTKRTNESDSEIGVTPVPSKATTPDIASRASVPSSRIPSAEPEQKVNSKPAVKNVSKNDGYSERSKMDLSKLRSHKVDNKASSGKANAVLEPEPQHKLQHKPQQKKLSPASEPVKLPTPSVELLQLDSPSKPDSETASIHSPSSINTEIDPVSEYSKTPFEESLNDLEVELADALDDDDDEVEAPTDKIQWSAGTAGTVQEEGDVSSEEE